MIISDLSYLELETAANTVEGGAILAGVETFFTQLTQGLGLTAASTPVGSFVSLAALSNLVETFSLTGLEITP
jgi:hypothetical protein